MNKLKTYRSIIAVIVFYILFKLYYSTLIPLWDGWSYIEIIIDAVSVPFYIFHFDFVGHSTFLYVFLIGVLQYLDIGNVILIHFSNIVLTVFSIIAFWKIARWLFSKKENQKELYFITFLYSIFPVISASSLHINPDYGVMLFFLYCLYFFIQKRFVLAMLCGIGMVFSKETGVPLYAILVICFYFYNVFLMKGKLQTALNLLIHKIYFIVPVILFFLRMIILTVQTDTKYWMELMLHLFDRPMVTQYYDGILERVPYSYFLGVFVLNFSWILTIFFLLGLITKVVRTIFIKNKSVVHNSYFSRILLIIVILVLSYIPLTAYKTYTNFRYFLPLYPLLILLFYWGLIELIYNKCIRRTILFIIVLLFFTANFRTLDLVSKKIYGTFRFGNHDMLKTVSITGECCGYGRDQIVYNLEYTHIHYLLNQIIKDIKPDEKTVFTFDPAMHPLLFGFDKKTFKRTLYRKNRFFLTNIIYTYPWINPKPEKVYFIDIPISDTSQFLASYLNSYKIIQEKTYSEDGYFLKVYTLSLQGT